MVPQAGRGAAIGADDRRNGERGGRFRGAHPQRGFGHSVIACRFAGPLAQLVARLHDTQEVVGSSPARPTGVMSRDIGDRCFKTS